MKLYILIFMTVLTVPGFVLALESKAEIKKGNALFKQSNFDEAITYYQKVLNEEVSALAEYNLGTAYYKKGDFVHAVEHLRKSVVSKDLHLKPNYNLANALYKLGKVQETIELDSAVKSMEEALDNYKEFLKIHKTNKDAKYNYEYVKKEYDRLKKEQKKKPKNGKKGTQNQDYKNNQDKDQQNNQSNEQKEGQKKDSNQISKKEGKDGDQKAPKVVEENKDQQKSKEGQKEGQEERVSNEDLTKREAKEILEDYERNEEPKGLLNFIPKDKGERPVDKDW